MSHKKIVVFYKEYHPQESIYPSLENCLIATAIQSNLKNSPICYVIDALKIIAEINQLKLNRKEGFSKARKILINSVTNN
jgi:hypothetical protein